MQCNRGAHSLRCWATAARAARPASLASSARTEVLVASPLQATECEVQPEMIGARSSIHVVSGAATFRGCSFHSPSTQVVARASCVRGHKHSMFGKAELGLPQAQALRRSAKPNARGRAGTSCYAARAGGFGLFAGGATQRKMQVVSVLHALPNPSIEGDVQGLSPLAAPHVKR
jgi:hypothetical protein